MKTTYTPGPWSWEYPTSGFISITTKGSDDIAEIRTQDAGGSWAPEHAEANARLIAAAPELVAVLRDLIDTYALNELRDGDYMDVSEARALLARIEEDA